MTANTQKRMNNLTDEASSLFARLADGDLMILGARPRLGKTQLGLGLAVEAMRSGRNGAFFTLVYSADEVFALFETIGADAADFGNVFKFDASDRIDAAYIMAELAETPAGTVVVVDYLQLLDRKSENPELSAQLGALKSFAAERGLIMVFLSQIDRSSVSTDGVCPTLEDVRLPNPLDLSLFDKACFLSENEMRFSAWN
ncbi:MAG TPA: DNA helicase [Pyrinomonadaceae bacterium]|nr:DNA helicase [Pyrinomonadaceae bacterium]